MNHVLKIFNFGVFDYKDAEKLLNQMAEKGYEFKGTGKGWIKGFAMFKKNAKGKLLKYAIDVRCGMSENEKEKYYEFYKDLGWKNVDCFRNKIHIFVCDKSKGFPLYTDEISELKNLKEGIRADAQVIKHSIVAVIIALVTGFMIYEGGIGFNSIVSYSLIVFFTLFLVYSIFEIVGNIAYTQKCKRCIETGERLPQSSIIKELRLWNSIFSIATFILFPTVAIVGYSYEIWGVGLDLSHAYSTNLEIFLLSMCVISIPVLLVASYMFPLYPKQSKLKMLSYMGYFMYFVSSYEYFITYLTR